MIEYSAELTMVNTEENPGWAHFELWLRDHGWQNKDDIEAEDQKRAARLFYEWGLKPGMEPGLDL